jgi:hypothetical protein
MTNPQTVPAVRPVFAREELPLGVGDAAVFLGLSAQAEYLWMERKQMPQLPMMGRNIHGK